MALRAGRDGGLHLVGVHREVGLPDVHEDRSRADLQDDAGGGVEGEADGDDLVARPDAEAPQDGFLGHRAVGHEDGVAHAAVGRPGLLELLGLAAHGQHPGAQHVQHRRLLGRPDVGPREGDHAGTSAKAGAALGGDAVAAPVAAARGVTFEAGRHRLARREQAPAAGTDPAEQARRVAGHERVVGHGVGHHGPRADRREAAHVDARDDDRARPDGAAVVEVDLVDLPVGGRGEGPLGGDRAGVAVVGQDGARAR